MLVTDETQNYLDFQRSIIYYLVSKLGGTVEINVSEVQALMTDPDNVFLTRDTLEGFALKIDRIPRNK